MSSGFNGQLHKNPALFFLSRLFSNIDAHRERCYDEKQGLTKPERSTHSGLGRFSALGTWVPNHSTLLMLHTMRIRTLGIVILVVSLIFVIPGLYGTARSLVLTGSLIRAFDFLGPRGLLIHLSLLSLLCLIGISGFGIMHGRRWALLLYSVSTTIGVPFLVLVSVIERYPIHLSYEALSFPILIILLIPLLVLWRRTVAEIARSRVLGERSVDESAEKSRSSGAESQ